MNIKTRNTASWLVAIVLIIVGLKFTSIGVGPGNLIQNDGYNVVGGFMTLLGGVIIGMLINLKTKK